MSYLDPLSVTAGDELRVMVSAAPGPVQADLVRLISGDSRLHGTGYAEVEIASSLSQTFAAARQTIERGSYAHLPDLPKLDEFTLTLWVYPTTPERDGQIIVSSPSFDLGLERGRLVFVNGTRRLRASNNVAARRWHEIELRVEAARVCLRQTLHGEGPSEAMSTVSEATAEFAVTTAPGDWRLAGPGFNGKLEAPEIRIADGVLAAWDFSQDMAGSHIVDTSGHGRHGALLQTPTRAVKGHTWDGSVQRWLDDPTQYAAVHFHEDDLSDAGWQVSLRWRVPEDLPSGSYAVRLRDAMACRNAAAGRPVEPHNEDHAPFFVRPAVGNRASTRKRPAIVYLAATATYLAYANQSLRARANPRPRNAYDAYQLEHPEMGDSLYEYHVDRSGVHFSSRRRPIVNLKPRTLTWSFNADTNIVAWLEQTGIGYDVVTDEDLHLEGAALLTPYRTVVTGAHPEYYSTSMWDAVAGFLEHGGRLMYLGGNGFYWRIAYHPEDPAIIEVRRAEDGTRAWMAEPGEYYHAFTGEYGGLWRRLGRPPNKLVGIGFAAQGFDGGTHYRLADGARNPRVAFALDGVESTGIIGDYGTQGGGAAGEEIDRHDLLLGSPAHAVVIARSENHRPGMLRTIEEIHMTGYPAEDEQVRADMVFFETPAGGAVFSVGSISYAGALSVNGYDNDIQTLSRNVLNRFTDPTPFEMPS